MVIQLKKGRDGPSTLTCVRADGSRTWGKEHPFFDFAKPGASAKLPLQALLAEHLVGVLDRERALAQPLTAAEVNQAVIASVSPADRARFKPLTAAQLASVRALRYTLESRWWDLAPGATLEVAFPAEP